MRKRSKILSGALAVACLMSTITPLGVSADNGVIYDGRFNVRGFEGGEYDDSKYRDGGYDAGYAPEYDYTKDENQELKFLIDENFAYNKLINHQGETFKAPSGWDARNLGGNFTERYFFHQGLVDTSEKFPVELNRQFETVNHGKLTLDFIYVPLEKAQDGITFTLGQGGTPAIKYITREDGLYLQQADGNDIFIGKYNVRPTDENEKSWGTEETVYNNGIRTIFNMDTKTIEKIFCDGILVKENVPFTNGVDTVDNFNINTGDKNTGKLWMRGVKLHRGYLMHDQFISSKLNVPSDYNADGKVSMMNMQSGSPWDYTNMVLENGAKVTKYVDKVQNDQMVYETCFYLPEKTDGYQIKLAGNGNDTIAFSIRDNKFWYSTNGEEKELYSDYFSGVWYKIRTYMDLESKKADIYVNGIKRAEDIDLVNDTIEVMEAVNNGDTVYLDFNRLWYDEPEPEDYCPEPQPATPKDPNMLVGMQFCPMWRNGYHVGWDSLNMYKEHIPYLGYYDEGDPEVNDWMIKQLVEHGFNFQRVTIVADTPGPYENPTFGWSFIDEGLKYAKYKSMLPYCVLMETGSVYHPTREYFLGNYLPYMIEHYFKDPDYLKIDGRPVLSCWTSQNFFAYAGTAEDAKIPLEDKIPLCQDFLKEIRKMCIDAGVGDPIIAMNLGPNEETLKLYKEIGIDCSMPYGSSSGATVKGQINDIDKSVEYKDILDKTIALSPGYAGQPWQFTSSGVIKTENYKKIVDHYLEVRDQFDPDSFAHNFICLDTYDEYGEGHWVAPSGGQGWGFFDVIYEAFCEKDADAHDHDYAHQVPTVAQRDRFNNLYPANRRLETVDVVESAPEEPLADSTVAKGWYFDGDEDAADWGAVDIEDLKIENGCLSGLVTGRDSQVYTPMIDVDYHGLTHVKIRVKYDVEAESYVGGNQLFFITHDGGGFTEQKAARAGGVWSKTSGDNGFVEIYYPIAGSNLVDNLKQVRFDVIDGAAKDEGGAKFMIDSIELIYNKEYDKSEAEKYDFDNAPSYVTVDGEVKTLNSAPKKINGQWYYPLRQLSVYFGGKVDYDRLNDKTTVLYTDKYAQLNNSAQTAEVNERALKADPVVLIENGTSYVTDKFFKQLFAKELSYDENSRMISFEELNVGGEKVREIITSSEFNGEDTEGWTVIKDVDGLSVKDGKLSGKVSGKNPAIVKSGYAFKASDIKNIQIQGVNNTDSDKVKVYFITGSDSFWNDLKAFTITLGNDGKLNTADFDPSTCGTWGGNITSLRIVPQGTKGDFAIDHVRIEGDWRTIVNADDSMTVSADSIKWDFEKNSTKDGWIFGKDFSDCKATDGALSGKINGADAALYTICDLGIDASKVTEIEVKYKNLTDGTKAKMMFAMDSATDYDNAPFVEFDVKANDADGSVYTIPVSDIEGFRGELNGICFMPADGKGDVEIDSITVKTAK